jgi:flavin-dependent thymidylate synthase
METVMAKIELAGFNIDYDLINEIRNGGPVPEDLTPETISAAYARISRDPTSVGELRRISRTEVMKARKSNAMIVFGMGHHSVAEHAVFNFDVTGVSRLAIESLESHRLASYTEKSQRYIKLDDDFVIAPEIKQRGLSDAFKAYLQRTFSRYQKLVDALVEKGMDEKLAGEDARYVLPLAVPGQLGMTINARSLEHLIKRLAAHPLTEIQDLSTDFLRVAGPIAPSLIRFVEPGHYDLHRFEHAIDAGRKLASQAAVVGLHDRKQGGPMETGPDVPVRMIACDPEGDTFILATLLQGVLNRGLGPAVEWVRELSHQERAEVFEAVTKGLMIHDTMPREFEHANMTFEIILSAAAYGQFKRHRMASITTQSYDPALGVTVPISIVEAGLSGVMEEARLDAMRMADVLGGPSDPVSGYAWINANRRRCAMTVNLREFYHMSRLREDAHAQWDIRAVVSAMSVYAKRAFPVCGSLLGGKDMVEPTMRERNLKAGLGIE